MPRKALAELVGRSEEWLRQIEVGKRRMDSIECAIRLAEVLHAPDLLGALGLSGERVVWTAAGDDSMDDVRRAFMDHLTTRAFVEDLDDWAAPAAVPAGPIDLALVSRSWGEVMQRVQAASRVTATFLEHGRLAGLENRQVVVEFSPDHRFHAEALGKNGRDKHVEAVLEAVLGGGLSLRVVVGDSAPAGAPAGDPEPGIEAKAPAGDPAVPPVVEAPPVEEFEIDPANDQSEPLDSDADARAVADWAARELGGQVIDEHPNKASGGRRARAPKPRERSERGKR